MRRVTENVIHHWIRKSDYTDGREAEFFERVRKSIFDEGTEDALRKLVKKEGFL
jgi:hypothetical protein